MKVLAHVSMLLDVESEEEAEAIRLAVRQNFWMQTVAAIEAAREKGVPAHVFDELSYFEPTIIYPMEIEVE